MSGCTLARPHNRMYNLNTDIWARAAGGRQGGRARESEIEADRRAWREEGGVVCPLFTMLMLAYCYRQRTFNNRAQLLLDIICTHASDAGTIDVSCVRRACAACMWACSSAHGQRMRSCLNCGLVVHVASVDYTHGNLIDWPVLFFSQQRRRPNAAASTVPTMDNGSAENMLCATH